MKSPKNYKSKPNNPLNNFKIVLVLVLNEKALDKSMYFCT